MSRHKASLAETIEAAKIAIEDASKIVIDRADSVQSSSSKKRAKRRYDATNENLKSWSASAPYDYERIGSTKEWRDRLIAILKEKDDEISDLEQQQAVAEEEEKKLKELNKILESKCNELSKAPSSSSRKDEPSLSNIDDAETEIKKLQSLVAFYEKLTCMSVRPTSEEHKFICTVKNYMNRTAIKFELGSVMSSEIVFRPIANIQYLPEYLHEEISFEAPMAPVMMGDILQSLYEEKNE